MERQAQQASSGKRLRRQGGASFFGVAVIAISLICIGSFTGLLLRPQVDPGCRVWLLNHAPDQVAIVDPYRGVQEKSLSITDGLRGLTFSRDGKRCFIFGVVDVTNKLSVLNTVSYLNDDTLELDGIPQGIAVFPDDNKVAMILGAKTDFMSGGFDVLDLNQRSKADPAKRVNLMRVRDLQLSHKLAVGDDGDRIYLIDAKDSKLFVFSLKEQRKVKEIDLQGAPEDFIYPQQGDYYYASVLQHLTIYQVRKDTDEIVGGYVFSDVDPMKPFVKAYLRHMAVDSTGRYLYATLSERHAVATWELGNPEYLVDLKSFRTIPGDDPYQRITELPLYVPLSRFKVVPPIDYVKPTEYIPQPQLIATDPADNYLFVVDEEGALYIYDQREVFQRQKPSMQEPLGMPEPKPVRMFLGLANDTAEVRDIAVSGQAVRSGLPAAGAAP